MPAARVSSSIFSSKFYIHYEKIRKMELKDEHIHIHMAP